MEENIAILIIDLSGYTALTETHGSLSAADLIDRYIRIAESCMIGDSKIHERTGDEIMVVSTSANFLLATAIMIERYSSGEEHFLQVHGGLHIGKVLKRKDSYFGSALNLSSRIASKADAGAFCCSREFADAITDNESYVIRSKGMHSFKNIAGEKEIFEISSKNKKRNYIDPVCRMQIVDQENAISLSANGPLYFCSSHCLEIYKNQEVIHN